MLQVLAAALFRFDNGDFFIRQIVKLINELVNLAVGRGNLAVEAGRILRRARLRSLLAGTCYAKKYEVGAMSTKELIEIEIQRMDENQLNELYQIVRQIAETKTRSSTPSLMSKLKQVKIQAPEDFATNLNLYASGEKRVA